jgi:hypothetical protein
MGAAEFEFSRKHAIDLIELLRMGQASTRLTTTRDRASASRYALTLDITFVGSTHEPEQCAKCHVLNGVGVEVGPDLPDGARAAVDGPPGRFPLAESLDRRWL